MHRIDIDETKFSDARILAWNKILPYYYLPILDGDLADVEDLTKYLEKGFSKQALRAAVKRLGLKRNFPSGEIYADE